MTCTVFYFRKKKKRGILSPVLVLFIAIRNTPLQVINSEDAWPPVAFCFGQLYLLARRYHLRLLPWVPRSCNPAEWVQYCSIQSAEGYRANGYRGDLCISHTLASTRQTVWWGQGLSGPLLVQGTCKSCTTSKIPCSPLSSRETTK